MFLIFPYRIDRAFKMPWATLALILVNVLMFVLSALLGIEWVADTLGFRMNMWAPVTWLSASFLHADVLHIAGNMYFLWLFGSVVEDALGPWRTLGVYLAGGFASAITHGLVMLLLVPGGAEVPMIGASGALAAIMGLFAVRFYKTKIRVAYFVFFLFMIRYGTFAISSVAGIALWFARDVLNGLLGVALGVSGGVASWAHLGGAAFGAALGLLSGQVRAASTEYLAEDAKRLAVGGTHEVAAAKYAELAQNDPSNPEWQRRHARELACSGSDAQAIRSEFLKAIQSMVSCRRSAEALDTYIEADGLVGTAGLDHSTLLAIAAEAERRPDWACAEQLYTRVIEEWGGTPAAEKALFRLAHVYLGMGAHDRAAATWGAFTDLHPESEWNAFADPALRQLA